MMLLGLVDRLRLIVFPVILGAGGREPIYAGYGRTGLIETGFLTLGLPSPNTGLRSFEGRRVCFSVQVCLRDFVVK
jgi:hypothetical protein